MTRIIATIPDRGPGEPGRSTVATMTNRSDGIGWDIDCGGESYIARQAIDINNETAMSVFSEAIKKHYGDGFIIGCRLSFAEDLERAEQKPKISSEVAAARKVIEVEDQGQSPLARNVAEWRRNQGKGQDGGMEID